MNKKYINIIITIVASFIVLMLLINAASSIIINSIPSLKFKKNEDIIVEIADYFINLPYGYVSISSSDDKNTLFVADSTTARGKDISIGDSKIENDINILFKKNGYFVIEKGANYIRFITGGLLNNSQGFIYFMTENTTTDQINICSLVKLPEGGWYYYTE